MKILTSKKSIILALSLASIVIAGTIKDINSRSVSMTALDFAEDTPIERSVASKEPVSRNNIAIMKVKMSESHKINGEWEVTRIVGADKNVTFDKKNNPEDANKKIKVPMKLINTSEVMVNNDPELVYKVSLLSNFGTIAIYKTINGGQEILEAKRVKKIKKVSKVSVNGEVDLVLERALNQSKSTKILTGSEVFGEMKLTKKSIEGLSISLTNTNGEVQHIDISSAQLMDGGSFKADVGDEEVSGVIFNNGKDGYRLSFVTGPLAGAMLNFVTKDSIDEVQDRMNEINEDYISNDAVMAEVAEKASIEERVEVASNDNYEAVRVLSPEEIKETAETKGFAF